MGDLLRRRPQRLQWLSCLRRGMSATLLLCSSAPFAPALLVFLVLTLCRGVHAGTGTDSKPPAAVAAASSMHFVLASDLASVDKLDPSARGTTSRSYQTQSASMEFVSACEIADADGPLRDARLPAQQRGSSGPHVREGNYHGWVSGPGPGRGKGRTVKVRDRARDVLTVVLCTELNRNLRKHFDDGGIATRALSGLRPLRSSLKSVTDKALRQRAWWMGRSGSIGVLLHMGTSRSRLDKHRLPSYAINVTRGVTGQLNVSCSGPEKCLDECGCDFAADMAAALEAVRAATALSMAEVFTVLETSVRHEALTVGTAVPYGKSLSVVRSGTGSWPFAVVRKTVAGRWICIACPVADGECGHRVAAAGAADALQDTDDDDDGTSRYQFPDDGPDEEDVLPGKAGEQSSRYRLVHASRLPRDLVPPNSAQQANTSLVLAASTGISVEYRAPAACPFCSCGPVQGKEPTPHYCRVEFADGSIDAKVYSWRCPRCRYRVMIDGRDEGLVFSSPFTAYSEAFLFELAVNLSRNGSSLRSSADLRCGFSELSAPFKYRSPSGRLRSLTTLRKALVTYLELAIKGLPRDVSTCRTCARPDGSLAVVCFDGLQLGYKVKYKKAFVRPAVRTGAIPRASVYAHVVRDLSTAKALGSILKVSKSESAKDKSVTTITALRGWVMAVRVLWGDPPDPDKPELSKNTKKSTPAGERGWDAAADGGVRPELTHFLGKVFCCCPVARELCIEIAGASADLRRRIPQDLRQRILGMVAHDPNDDVDGAAVEPARVRRQERAAFDGTAHVDGARSAVAGELTDQAAVGLTVGPAFPDSSNDNDGSDGSEASTEMEDSDDELTSADDRISVTGEAGDDEPGGVWDKSAPLLHYAELFKERALADSGGAAEEQAEQDRVLRLQPSIPTTAAASHNIINFVRAVAVDPFTLWAPGGKWDAVNALIETLDSPFYTSEALAAVLDDDALRELRLLRDATACLGPAFAADRTIRAAFSGVLSALKAAGDAYDTFVATNEMLHEESDADSDDSINQGSERVWTKEAMASAHPSETFSPSQYATTWLKAPATVESYRAAYSTSPRLQREGLYLESGVWAPSFPIVRPTPNFEGDAAAATDEPDCSHLMGRENKYTGGTFGAFCTCAHPKCVGVVVLDGSEGQRMPIEFIVQRLKTLPEVVVYDFSCATLKTALCRLPYVGRTVRFLVDRFHWRKNHVMCSKGMNPDSYSSMEGVNTSSSEERNALSRRQEHHLRLMKQDNFIIFTTYQQALSNVIAMYRDEETSLTPCRWPRWYRERFVDTVGNTERY